MDGGLEGVEHLLVVDDNPGDIRLIEEAFEHAQLTPTIHTTTTKDGALDYLSPGEAEENGPDLDVILLDWHLSNETGKEVLQAARSVTPAISVVVMTGSKVKLNALRTSNLGVDSYIEKQTEPEAYIEILDSCLAE